MNRLFRAVGAVLLLVCPLLLAGVLGCPPAPIVPTNDASDAATDLASPPPPPPAVDGGACVGACSALAGASCPVGTMPSCPAFLAADVSSMQDPTRPSTLYDGSFLPLTCERIVQLVHVTDDARRLGFGCTAVPTSLASDAGAPASRRQ